jgi:hypothetical protein
MPWLTIFGWIGSALVVVSLTQARVLRFRWLNLAGSVIAAIVNVLIPLWPFVAMNGAIAIINIYWLWKLYRHRDDEATYAVVEVAPNDGYLRHVQRDNAADLANFAPDFVPLPVDGERRYAFLVVKGSETVGMVEIRDDGGGLGTVLLDWVAPRFRDFTPGVFVYRQSGVIAAKGIKRLRIGPNVVLDKKYLTKVGFAEDSDGWVLDV